MPRASSRLAVLAAQVCARDEDSEHGVSVAHCSAASAPKRLLDGKVAIITGAGQGIGAEAAKLFAQHGAKVVASDIDEASLRKVVADIQAAGGEGVGVTGDITDPHTPACIVHRAVSSFGRIDVLVNNAGFTWDAVLHKMTEEQWEAMLAVHCTAPWRLIRAAEPHMRGAAKRELDERGEADARCVLNVSSVSGTHGNAGQVNYSTAKAGVVGLTKALAREWGPFNVRANAVAFGWVATRLTAAKEGAAPVTIGTHQVKLGIPMADALSQVATAQIPLQRVGTPTEAAAALLLLASPLGSYVTGQVLEVDGGLHA